MPSSPVTSLKRTRFSSFTTYHSHPAEVRTYELPTLNTQQLQDCLKEMHLFVAERDLLHPSSQRTQHLYECILHFLVPWRTKHLETAKQNASNTFGYMELRQDITSIMALYKQMKILLEDIRYLDFSMQDVLNPTPQRLARVLSALINYAKFRQQEWNVFENLAFDAEKYAYEASQLAQKNDDVRRRIAGIEDQRRAEEPQIEAAEEENARYEEKLREMRHVADEQKAVILKLKEDRKELKDALYEVNYKFNNARVELKLLEERSKFNPHKAREHNALLQDAIRQDRQGLEEAEMQLQTLVAQTETLARVAQDLETCIHVLRNASEKKAEYDEHTIVIKRRKMATTSHEQEVMILRETIHEAQHRLDELREDMARMERLQQQKRETIQLQLQENENILKSINDTVEANERAVTSDQTEMDQLQHELQQCQSEFAANKQRLQTVYTQVAVKVDALFDRTNAFTKHQVL